MDIKEQLEEAHKELVEKFSDYLKAETDLANQANGFFDKSYLDNMIKTKTEWQLSSNRFYGLLSYLAKNKE